MIISINLLIKKSLFHKKKEEKYSVIENKIFVSIEMILVGCEMNFDRNKFSFVAMLA